MNERVSTDPVPVFTAFTLGEKLVAQSMLEEAKIPYGFGGGIVGAFPPKSELGQPLGGLTYTTFLVPPQAADVAREMLGPLHKESAEPPSSLEKDVNTDADTDGFGFPADEWSDADDEDSIKFGIDEDECKEPTP